jgi:serine/threonine protein kinase
LFEACVNATVLLTSVDINIPGYRIIKPIGEGGMASVFLATQLSLDREVALKVMSPMLASNSEFASRFLIEGKITAKLQHPNLVTVYDIGTHNGVYYLAAEYIPAGTLKERINEGGLLVSEILDVASDIALGLDFAHQKGFVHRDVKPGNVLFRNDGRVVLADFGIAKAMDGSNSSTVAGASIGTPDYMSPEQARGEPVDGRSDLYSLGTVLYEMLVGHPPYQASDPFTVALMHVTQPVPVLPEEFSWLQPLITGLMAKQPAERYNTGAAFVDAVHKLLGSAPEAAKLQQSSTRKAGGGNRISGSSATQQRTRVSMSKKSERPAWLWPAVGGVVIALVVSVWLFVGSGKKPDVTTGPVPTNTVPIATNTNPSTNPVVTLAQTNPDGNPPATAMSQTDIDDLLTQADNYLKKGTEPGSQSIGFNLTDEDDSALSIYRKVLQAQPDNARAKAGIENLLVFYRKFAYMACKMQRWPQCAITAKNGMLVDPADSVLLKLDATAEAGDRGENPKLPPDPGG